MTVIGVALLLLGGGLFFGLQALTDHVDREIPQGNLFGESQTPKSPGSSSSSQTPPAGADIKGPLNILIAGIDNRELIPTWIPHSDAVMILHVNADLRSGYLTSLPRDLVLDIPPFAPSHFSGRRTKLTHAMSLGSLIPGQRRPDWTQGFALLAKTVSAYTGIQHFDAGALLTFRGLAAVVNALGGVDLYVDQQVTSIHMRPDGHNRTHCPTCAHGLSGPQMVYHVGNFHFVGWQALDYSRQRY